MADKSGWERIRLGDIIFIKHGWPFKTEFISGELTGRPIVVNIGNFEYTGGFRFDSTRVREYRGEYPPDYELQSGDILLVMTCQTSEGEILGVPARVPDDGRLYLHNQRLGKVMVTCPDKVDSNFLYWLFLWREFNRWLFTSSSGTKILHTAPERIQSFEFDLPPLHEQHAIANILGSIEARIELNNQMNKNLVAIGQAIFKHWFIDFEFPNEEGRPYKSSGGEMTYQEELGIDVPKEWKVDRLGNHSIIKGRIGWKGLQISEYTHEGPFIVGGLQIKNDGVAWEECAHVTEDRYNESPEIMLRETDILMTKDGTIGKLAYITSLPNKATVASHIHVIRANSDRVSPEFLYYFFKSSKFQGLVQSRISGSVVPALTQKDITDMQMVLPDSRIASHFESVARDIQGRIAINSYNSLSLSKIRDSLLPRLMSEKIRVPSEI